MAILLNSTQQGTEHLPKATGKGTELIHLRFPSTCDSLQPASCREPRSRDEVNPCFAKTLVGSLIPRFHLSQTMAMMAGSATRGPPCNTEAALVGHATSGKPCVCVLGSQNCTKKPKAAVLSCLQRFRAPSNLCMSRPAGFAKPSNRGGLRGKGSHQVDSM